MEKNTELLKNLVGELLALMSLSSDYTISFDEENLVFNVEIDGGEATGLLIGKKGETLGSLENILGVMLKAKTGEWVRVAVNVGDYKSKEENYLKGLADSVVERVRRNGSPENIYNLKGWQRRIVHMHIAEKYNDIVSESTGEGDERCLVIKLSGEEKE